MNARQTRALMVGMIVLAGPVLFAFDLVARRFVASGQPDDVREMVGGFATQFAWMVVPGPLLGGIAGFLLYPRIYERQMASAARAADPARAAETAELTALMFAASIPQLPALLGDFCVMLGAELTPVLCSTTISVLAVLAIAARGRRAS